MERPRGREYHDASSGGTVATVVLRVSKAIDVESIGIGINEDRFDLDNGQMGAANT